MVSKRSPRATALAQVTKERARLAAAQADLAELKAAKQRGTLLDADAVEREWYDVPRIARAGILVARVGFVSNCAAVRRFYLNMFSHA